MFFLSCEYLTPERKAEVELEFLPVWSENQASNSYAESCCFINQSVHTCIFTLRLLTPTKLKIQSGISIQRITTQIAIHCTGWTNKRMDKNHLGTKSVSAVKDRRLQVIYIQGNNEYLGYVTYEVWVSMFSLSVGNFGWDRNVSSTSSESVCCMKGPTLCARDTSAEVMNQMHALLVLPAVAAGLCPVSFGDTLVFIGILRDSFKYSFIIQGNMKQETIRNLPQVDATQDQEIPMAWRFGCGANTRDLMGFGNP